MNSFFGLITDWLREFFPFLAGIFPVWFGSWVVCLLILLFSFRALKPRLRSRVLKFDEVMNAWARRLRYKLQQADAVLEPNTPLPERVLLTWFFRFWTNFASAPSLSVLAFAIPLWFFVVGVADKGPNPPEIFASQTYWLLPAFCYYGSMGLSYVLKRVFKRLRPVRDKGAFGHSLRDGSFPSGHSLTAFCFWIAMIVSVWHQTLSLAYTIPFAVVAISIILLTGLSRIYMAVHWPSDVAGGFVIGTVWAVIFFIACSGWFLSGVRI